jgi:sporulation protein YlmC with PRC-barrel domain
MGYDVWNQNGDQIGTVNDIVLDFTNSTISYVVVGTGGFLGLGEKKIPVPWNMVKVQTAGNGAAGDQNAVVYTGDQELYKNFPDVDFSTLLPGPGQSVKSWDADIQKYWQGGGQVTSTPEGGAGVTATPNPTATVVPGVEKLQGAFLASQLLRSTVQIANENTGTNNGQSQGSSTPAAQNTATGANSGTGSTGTAAATGTVTGIDTGNSLGTMDMTVDDVIVDPNTGAIQYIVVTGAFTGGQRTVAVPPKFLLWDAANQKFSLGVNTLALVNAPAFDNGQYPDFSSSDWSSKLDSYWNNLKSDMLNIAPAP